MTISDWLWFGAIAMAVGSAILLVMGWNQRTRHEENHYLLHLFVTLTATAANLAMALGQGSIHLADGRAFYVARYLDWSITTPMLLTGLCLTAMHSPFRRWALLLSFAIHRLLHDRDQHDRQLQPDRLVGQMGLVPD